MDPDTYGALMRNCWQVAGFLRTVDFRELQTVAIEHRANARELDMISVLGDAARRLPSGHL